jgi:nicotinate dehydrogenase subunit A
VPIRFTLNGMPVSTTANGEIPLLYVLKDQFAQNGPRFGCGLGECGACTVLLGDNVAIRSCSIPVSTIEGKSITTLQGLGTPEHPSPVQQAFIDHQAAQCGYCTNGMIMQATAFLRTTPHPSRAQIIAEMDNNLCRCGTHLRILAAIEEAAAKGGV